MLQQISIRNFAIIEHLELPLHRGFVAITGETGAGKSIILDALVLALGGRANIDMIRHGQKKAQIEVALSLTELQKQRLFPLLEEYGCPEDDVLYIKRIVTMAGRNRVFINGSMSSLRALQDISHGLVDVIGQHAGQELLLPQSHIRMLDVFTGVRGEAQKVADSYQRLCSLRLEVKKLQEEEQARCERMEYLQSMLSSIEDSAIRPGEDESLLKEIERMNHAEMLQERTKMAAYLLREGEQSAIDRLTESLSQLRPVAHLDEKLEFALQWMEERSIEMAEISRDLSRFAEQSTTSVEEIEIAQERLLLIEDLKAKHGGSIEGVLQAVKELHKEMDSLAASDERCEQAIQEAATLQAQLMKSSIELSKRRQLAALQMASFVQEELAVMGMPHCRFKVNFSFYDEANKLTKTVEEAAPSSLCIHGLDRLSFYISPNPGEGFKPLERIASGGELSRILLALKAALIKTDPVESYIFDEVDSGIGGGVAESVGRKLQLVGVARQAICITHLPQVACCAHHHLKVMKMTKDNRTVSVIKYLNNDERVTEIARMLGGVELTNRTKEHALEMLDRNRRSYQLEQSYSIH